MDLEVVEEPAVASAMLDPIKAKILTLLTEPGSATSVAKTLGLSRQKVNYHLRALEDHGLLRLFEERPRRGLTERVMVASARSYVVSPAALGHNAADPAENEHLPANYLIALATRIVREVAEHIRRADGSGRAPVTLAFDTEIRFASASDRAAFAAELSRSVTGLAAKYHDEAARRGNWYRVMVAAHPRPAAVSTLSKES